MSKAPSSVTKRPVWAIVRLDPWARTSDRVEDLATAVYVTAVHLSEEMAASEAERLNLLNGPRGAYSFYMQTRLKGGGRDHELL